MKQWLYRLVVPKPVRQRIYEANIRRFQLEEYDRRRAADAQIQRSELRCSYMENLLVLPDRTALLKQMPKRATVAQVGVSADSFSSKILLVTSPQRLILMDSFLEQGGAGQSAGVVANMFAKEISDGQVSLEAGSPLVSLAKYPHAYFDWVYVDSEPSYDTTSAILHLCDSRTNANGIITGNNYSRCDYINMARYGVIEAVHDFCKRSGWEMIYLTHESHRKLTYGLRRLKK